MPDADPEDTEPLAPAPGRPSREISDPKAMRALAHPVRLAILEAMRSEGALTASRAAELLGESPGNMSWHLQTLAKYGYIEEAEGGKGRSRPWKIVEENNRIRASEDAPGSYDAAEQLVVTVLERSFDQMQAWWDERQQTGEEWFQAAFVHEGTSFMTAAELTEFGDAMTELTRRFEDRTDPAQRPEGARPVHVVSFAHPLPRRTPPRT
jgi:DNA-binding transcriptional ArsR family regulator